MILDEIEVWTAIGRITRRAGTLRPSFQGGRVLASSSFEYDREYLRDGWQISPDLPLHAGRQFTAENSVLPGAIGDAAPDEWGEKLIRAEHAVRLQRNSSLPRRLGEYDYLLGVSDYSRLGALRFRVGETWMSSEPGVANLHELARIVEAAGRYEADRATDDDIAYLNDVATSPGGARPKANVVTAEGRLAIAKLPHSKDGRFDVERWEAVALTIARAAQLQTPTWRIETVGGGGGRAVLISERFDRDADGDRLAYISGRTALELGAHDDGTRLTYEDFTDAVAEWSTAPSKDLRELFGRIALTVLVNNVDDHWRNHAFIRDLDGWRLAPLFDVNPSPYLGIINSRAISDTDDPGHRQLRNLLATASAYRLTDTAAREVLRRVATAVAGWEATAEALGVPAGEREALRVAFDVDQRDWALSL